VYTNIPVLVTNLRKEAKQWPISFAADFFILNKMAEESLFCAVFYQQLISSTAA
jgi:hypothetical protein